MGEDPGPSKETIVRFSDLSTNQGDPVTVLERFK